jgi:hypothetical protein
MLLGGDFNAHIIALPNTIDTSNLCKLLKALELVEIKKSEPRQNCDANVGGWGYELLDLCCDAGLLIFNGWTLGDE